MADRQHLTRAQLVERLADAFEVLLEQVAELKHHNGEVNKLLGREQKVSRLYEESVQQDEELCIANGLEALGVLRRRNSNAQLEDGLKYRVEASIPEGHPSIDQKGSPSMMCPFPYTAKDQPPAQQACKMGFPSIQRPDSLPTPPDTREQYIDDDDDDDDKADEVVEEALTQKKQKLPPQAPITGSSSKCPIRMLDERPAEEVAEYFETHKHEIPRSHAICVKHYQSNEQSIRELDAKYGSLVNMIQGLGMKHQSLLENKDEIDGETMMKPGRRKVEKWADTVKPVQGEVEMMVRSDGDANSAAALDEREGIFDRPLKDIRVGESPSRPWGISVPAAAAVIQLEADDDDDVEFHNQRKPPSSTPTPKKSIITPPLPSSNKNIFAPHDRVSEITRRDDKPRVIFNGPVFIGYTPEQAAAFLQQIGTGR